MSSQPETGAFAHRARKALYVTLVAATGLTCVRDLGTGFALGTAAGWFLVLITLNMALTHQWDACSHCDGPPARVATPEARARLARRAHNKPLNRAIALLNLGLAAAAVTPKPYLENGPWWVRLIEAAVILTLVGTLLSLFLTFALHDLDKSECHVERCRAGKKAPRQVKKVRLAPRVIAHYAVWQLPVMVPVTFTIGMLALKGGLWEWVYALALLDTGLMVFLTVIHGELGCPTCMKRLPDNGGELAERRKPVLRAWHQGRYLLPCVALGMWVMSWAFAGTASGRIFVTAAAVLVTAYFILTRLHARAKPWCPWCRDGGGEGADEAAPDPSSNVPVPA